MIILKKSKSALKTLSMLLALGVMAIMMAGCDPNPPGGTPATPDPNEKVAIPPPGDVTNACSTHGGATCEGKFNTCVQNNLQGGDKIFRKDLGVCAANADVAELGNPQ